MAAKFSDLLFDPPLASLLGDGVGFGDCLQAEPLNGSLTEELER
ncbi:MAG: hypothetical protein ACRD4Q_12015 [Candidatus Acidiferrales bacterium]